MLKEVTIKNFRGIKHCKLSDMRTINVLIGPNNSGKSTIFDAIFFGLKGIFDPGKLREIIANRVHRDVDLPEIYYAYSDTLPIEITLTFQDDYWYELMIYKTREAKDMLRLDGTIIRVEPNSNILTFKHSKEAQELYYGDLGPKLEVSYLHSYKPTSRVETRVLTYARDSSFLLSHVRLDYLWEDLEELLAKFKLNMELEKEFINTLNDIYGLHTYEFVPMPISTDIKKTAFLEGNLRVFGDFHGAGVQRAALILAHLIAFKNTALFIEELETWQHPASLKKLIEHIVRLALQNRIQVFITTHSYHDCLRFIQYSVEEKIRENVLRVYKITKKPSGEVMAENVTNNIPEIIRSVYEEEGV